MRKTLMAIVAPIVAVLLNGFLGACLIDRVNPIHAITLLGEPASFAVFCAAGAGAYVIFLALTALFTLPRARFRESPHPFLKVLVISSLLHLGIMLLANIAPKT